VRIMHSDGAVYEGDLLCALRHLVIRSRRPRRPTQSRWST